MPVSWILTNRRVFVYLLALIDRMLLLHVGNNDEKLGILLPPSGKSFLPEAVQGVGTNPTSYSDELSKTRAGQ